MTLPDIALRAWRSCASLCRARLGATAVEFAFVLPAFVLVVFGIEEVGRLFWTQGALQYAVEQAARCAAVNSATCGTSAQIKAYAASQTPGMTISSSDFTASSPSCGHQVQASYAFTSLVPQLVPLSVTLSVQSCHP
jgi:Flp pilus assembly protein TadG